MPDEAAATNAVSSPVPKVADAVDFAAQLKSQALDLGFSKAGLCRAQDAPSFNRLQQWLAQGFAGEMHYLAARAAAYAHPRHVLPSVRSLLMLAYPYRTAEPIPPAVGAGRVSRYAWGQDYHLLIRDRLRQLAAWVERTAPGVHCRGVVDTAPLLEREFAQLAGLGWVGKHTLLIQRGGGGSWFFLAALLLDVELLADLPFTQNHCGTCTACITACPTQAIVAPYQLDARRCISYLTIEHRGLIAEPLRTDVQDWVFGCDVCQDVCPWNNKVTVAATDVRLQPQPGTNPLELAALFELDDVGFKARFGGTPLARPKRTGILRNAALVLGNQRAESALPALVRGLHDVDPVIRATCGWALGQIGTAATSAALQTQWEVEVDEAVRAELLAALQKCTATQA